MRVHKVFNGDSIGAPSVIPVQPVCESSTKAFTRKQRSYLARLMESCGKITEASVVP